MDAIQKIEEALAAGPTEGPWDASDWTEDDGPACTTIAASRPEVLRPGQTSIWRNGIVKIQVANTDDGESPLIDAAYIAACNPAAIREVLQTLASKEAELAAREAEIARLREALAVVDAQIPEDFDAAIDHAVLIALGNGDVKFIRAALTKQPPKD